MSLSVGVFFSIMIDGFNLRPRAANSADGWSVRITENGAVSSHHRKLPERRDNYIIVKPSIYTTTISWSLKGGLVDWSMFGFLWSRPEVMRSNSYDWWCFFMAGD